MKKVILFILSLSTLLFLIGCGDHFLKYLERAQYYLDNPDVSSATMEEAYPGYSTMIDEEKSDRVMMYNSGRAKTVLSKYFDENNNLAENVTSRSIEDQWKIVTFYSESNLGTINLSLKSMLSSMLDGGSFEDFAKILPDSLVSVNGDYDETSYNSSVAAVTSAQTIIDNFYTVAGITSASSKFNAKGAVPKTGNNTDDKETATTEESDSDSLTSGEQAYLDLLDAFLAFAAFDLVVKRFEVGGGVDVAQFITNLGVTDEMLESVGLGGEGGAGVISSALGTLGTDATEADIASFLESQGITPQ